MVPAQEERASITTISGICDWVGLVDGELGARPCRLARTSFLEELGAPALVRQLVAIAKDKFFFLAAASSVWKSKVIEVDGDVNFVAPPPVASGHIGVVRRVARLLLKLQPDEAPPAGEGSTPGPKLAPPPVPLGTRKNILASKVLDQNDDSEVAPLDAVVLNKLILD